MGSQKSELMASDRFAVLKAAEIAAEMVSCAEHERAGPSAIVMEAIGQGEWDDVVVHSMRSDGIEEQEQWQIKRQNLPIEPAKIAKILASMANLRARHLQNDNTSTLRFVMGFQSLVDLKGRSDLRLRKLQDLCKQAREPGVLTDRLLGLATSGEKPWCTFISDATQLPTEQLRGFLRDLRLVELGGVEEIQKQGAQHLRATYENNEDLYNQIFGYLIKRVDGRFEFNYELLYNEVLRKHGQRDPAAKKWFRAQRDHIWAQWSITGTTSVADCISDCWGKTQAGVVLNLAASPVTENDDAERALLRLAVHREEPSVVKVSASEEWNQHLDRRIGGTLGFAPNCKQHFGCVDSQRARAPVQTTRVAPAVLADELNGEMDAHTADSLYKSVGKRLSDPKRFFGGEIEAGLLAKMTKVWSEWHTLFESDLALRNCFMRSLVATATEWFRQSHAREIRVGPKAVPAMAQAIIYGLTISSVLVSGDPSTIPADSRKGNNLQFGGSWSHLIALKFVSNESRQFGVNIDQAAVEFMADESGCAILAGTSTSSNDIVKLIEQSSAPFHVTEKSDAGFQDAYIYKPILTAELGLRLAMQLGHESVSKFLAEKFQDFAGTEIDQLKEAVETTPLLEGR